MFLLKPPGVYRPQGDSLLLREALLSAPVPAGASVLDLGTGTGVIACAAARTGAAQVWAVDTSHRAVLTARCNARLRGLRIRVAHGDLRAPLPHGPFDVVTANPPYVPCPGPGDVGPGDVGTGGGRTGGDGTGGGRTGRAPGGGARAWDAGHDGRLYLDPLCRRAPSLLAPGGMLLLVHSALCGVPGTLRTLREAGLKASVVARRSQPFGPVLASRAAWLEERGLIAPGQREEELVVVRADRAATAG